MAEQEQMYVSPQWQELQIRSDNWPAMRDSVAEYNSGASDEMPTFEGLSKYKTALGVDESKLFDELLRQMLAQSIKPRGEKIEDWGAGPLMK